MKLTFGRVWHNPNFLKLWSGETISRIGSQVTTFSIPMLAALTLNATPMQMGYLGTAMYLPHLVTPLFAGAWVDHHQRKPIMILANLLRALLIGSIPLGAYFHWMSMEYLYIACFLNGIAQVFFELAYHSYFPTLIEREDLVDANSKIMASISFSEIGGPALAGFLVDWITAPFALIVDSFSFLVSVLTLAGIRKEESLPASILNGKTLVNNIREGFQIVLRIPPLRAMAGEATTFNLFAIMFQTVFTLYATRELGLAPVTIGLIYTVASFGSLVGAALSEKASMYYGLGRAMLGSIILACVPYLLLLALGTTKNINIFLLTVSFMLSGAGISSSQVFIWSIRRSVTPDGKLGRMNASYRFFVTGITPLGAMLGGALGETLGLQMTVSISAIGFLFILPWIIFSPLPSLQTLPERIHLHDLPTPAISPAD